MQFFKDIKNVVILTLVVLFFIGIPHENSRFILWVLSGVLTAVFVDAVIHRLIRHSWDFPKSAIISGLIVSGVLSFDESFWLIFVFSSLAIISKYIIRLHKKHFLNPANMALFIATLFHFPLTWILESNRYVLILAGLYFVYRLKKWGQVIGFIVVFSALMFIDGAHPFNMISWFFVFIMLIEPKTSGFGFVRGIIFGLIAGIVSFLILTFFPQYDFFVVGLFIANLCNPVLDHWENKRKPQLH